ncbi:MAG: hypothetical protein IAE81_23455 [Caldilineaceae bacterium]|nr:hypothetical protein [Caldilineaceae bacterium]
MTVFFTLASIEVGYWLGKRWQRSAPNEKEGGVGALAGATLGLLAFLLAFTVGIAVNRYDTRRQLVVNEANAIGTTFLRAGYLDEPQRQEIQDLLRDYVDLRLAAVGVTDLTELAAQSEEIHAALWAHAETLARAQPESEMIGLFIVALNELIDLHTVRYISASTQLPFALFVLLYVVTFLAMVLVGMQSSFGSRQNILALVVLALVFAAVVLLVVDLNRSQEGVLNVNQQAMMDLQRQLQPPAP